MRTPTQSRPASPSATGQPLGRSIVACQPVQPPSTPVAPADSKFYAVDPHSGDELGVMYLAATEEDIDNACWAAWRAFHTMGERPAADRATLLEKIADNVLALGESLVATAGDETGLGPARLVSERDRMVATLRLFAGLVRQG